MDPTSSTALYTIEATLPPRVFAKVRAALPPSVPLIAHSANHAPMSGSGARRIAIVDPLLIAGDPEEAINRLFADVGPGAVVAYASADAASIGALLMLVRRGVHHVLLAGFDDTPEKIREVVESVATDAAAARLMQKLAARTGRLPPSLARSFVDLLRRPEAYPNAAAVCSASMLPRRSCDRSVRRAGLASLQHMVRGTRVLHAWGLLQSPRVTLDAAAARVGASSAKALSEYFKRVCGTAPRDAVSLSETTVLRLVLQHVCAPRHAA